MDTPAFDKLLDLLGYDEENCDIIECFARNIYRKRRASILPARPPRSTASAFFQNIGGDLDVKFSDSSEVFAEIWKRACIIPAPERQANGITQPCDAFASRDHRRPAGASNEVCSHPIK